MRPTTHYVDWDACGAFAFIVADFDLFRYVSCGIDVDAIDNRSAVSNNLIANNLGPTRAFHSNGGEATLCGVYVVESNSPISCVSKDCILHTNAPMDAVLQN